MARKERGTPVYLQVALDIAAQIADGDMKEGQRFSGRSMMSSKYGVSPETIRRALGLLNEMDIVDIEPGSGVIVKSQSRAIEYGRRHSEAADIHQLKSELDQLIARRRELDERIERALYSLTDLSEQFRRSSSLQTFEFTIARQARIEGMSIAQSAFRRATGATILALKRDREIILSPSPDTLLCAGDVLIVICDMLLVPSVSEFITQTK